MQDMIGAQPTLVEALLAEPPAETAAAAGEITAALDDHQPVTVCGCGSQSTPPKRSRAFSLRSSTPTAGI